MTNHVTLTFADRVIVYHYSKFENCNSYSRFHTRLYQLSKINSLFLDQCAGSFSRFVFLAACSPTSLGINFLLNQIQAVQELEQEKRKKSMVDKANMIATSKR